MWRNDEFSLWGLCCQKLWVRLVTWVSIGYWSSMTFYQKGTPASYSDASLTVHSPSLLFLSGFRSPWTVRAIRDKLVLLWDGLFCYLDIVRFVLDQCSALVLIFSVMLLFKIAWSIIVTCCCMCSCSWCCCL